MSHFLRHKGGTTGDAPHFCYPLWGTYANMDIWMDIWMAMWIYGYMDIWMEFFCMLYCPRTMTSQAEPQKFRSTAWTGLTFTTHTTWNAEQNRLALRVTGGQPVTTVARWEITPQP